MFRIFKGSVSLKGFQIALRKAGIVAQILDRRLNILKNLNTASGPYTLAFALITGLRVSGLFFDLLETLFQLAGVAGFEPANAAVKVLCLTA